jgi:Zn-dependent metalloprotease
MKRISTLLFSLFFTAVLFGQGKQLDLSDKNTGPKIKVENLKPVKANPAQIPSTTRPFYTGPVNWAQLKDLSPVGWPVVQSKDENGLAIAISGILPNVALPQSKSIEDQSFAYLEIMKEAIGIANPEKEFKIIDIRTDDIGMTHIRLQQQYEGIPVHGKEWILHAKDGKINFANGRNLPTPNISIPDNPISDESAIQTSLNDLANKTKINRNIILPAGMEDFEWDEKELVIWSNKDQSISKLAWRLDIHPNLITRYRYFIDAETGDILESYPNHCKITHYDFTNSDLKPVNPDAKAVTTNIQKSKDNSPLANGPRTAIARDLFNINRTINTYEFGSNFYFLDASRPMHNSNGSIFPNNALGVIWTSDARNTSPVNNNFSAFHITSSNNSWNNPTGVSAHYNGGESYLYFKNVHGRNSINGRNGNILSFINVVEDDGTAMDNAFWNGKGMFYGNGNIGFSSPLAKSLDVAGHEMSHGVIETTANLEYQDEPGALNESFADIFGVMIDRDDWKLGDDVANPNYFPTGTMRDMQNPHNGGNNFNDPGYQPSHYNERYTGTEDNGGVHINSGIPNHAYYLFATANGVGKEKAEKVFYRALDNYLTASSRFVDFRIATLKAASDLHGLNTPVYNALKSALDAVGIPGGQGGNYQNDYPENPGDPYMIVSDINNTAIYLVDGQGNVIGDPFIDFGAISRISVTDDGSYAVFIGEDNTMYEINFTTNSYDQIQNEAIWRNVAISKDGSRLAAITTDYDNIVYIYDFGRQSWGEFELYNPTYTSGISTGDVVYPDILEWDFSGQWVMYDAYNEIGTFFGSIDYWDIGFVNVWNNASNNFANGEVDKLYSGLAENTSVGNPTFSKLSPYIISFDYINSVDDQNWILSANLETGDVSDPPIFQNLVLGYPNFTPNDRYISFDALDNSDNEIIALQEISSDKLRAVSNASIFINGGTQGVWFADGFRPLSTDNLTNGAIGLLSPNPANDYLKLELEKNIPVDQIHVYNLLGQEVKQLNPEQMNTGWNISELKPGVYFLNVYGDGKLQAGFRWLKN